MPQPKRHRISCWQTAQVGGVFFLQLATNGLQTVDFLKQHVDRLQQGAPVKHANDRGPCRVCLPLVKRWRVEEAVNHSKWRNLKTSGTSPRNVLKHIHPSIHPSMCDMFWGAKFQFAYFASHVEERYTQHSYCLGCSKSLHSLPFTWQFFCVAAVRWFL